MTASIFDVISKICVTMCISNRWNWTYPQAKSNPFALTHWATKHNDANVTINKGQLSPQKMLEMHELLRHIRPYISGLPAQRWFEHWEFWHSQICPYQLRCTLTQSVLKNYQPTTGFSHLLSKWATLSSMTHCFL